MVVRPGVAASPPPPPPSGSSFIGPGPDGYDVPYLHNDRVAVLQELWNGGVSPHPWATIVKNRADGSVSDDVGQWDLLAWRMTGTLSYGQAAVAQAWSTFHDLVAVNPGPDYVREYAWWFVLCYPWLSSLMDGASGRPTTTQWLDRIDQWATAMITGSPSGYTISIGDSDRVVSFYSFLRLVDAWTPLGNDYTSQLDPSVKTTFDDYWTRAAGGEWLEGTEYNLGTVQLMHLAINADDPDHYTGYAAWVPEAAETLKWQVTPDWLSAVAWSDCQEYTQTRYYERLSLCSMYAALLPAGADRTAMLNYLGQMLAEFTLTSSNVLHLYRALLFFDPREIPASPSEARPTGLRSCPGVGLVMYRDPGHRSLTYWVAFTPPFVDHYQYAAWHFRSYLDGEWVANQVIGYQTGFGLLNDGYPAMHLHDADWLQTAFLESATLDGTEVTVVYKSSGPDWNAPWVWPSDKSLGVLNRVVVADFSDLDALTINQWDYVTANDVTNEGWWPAGVASENQTITTAAKAAGRVYTVNAIATVAVAGTPPVAGTGSYAWTTPGGLAVTFTCPDLDAGKASAQLTNATNPSMPSENWSNHDVYQLTFKDATVGSAVVRESQYFFGVGTPPPIPTPPPAP